MGTPVIIEDMNSENEIVFSSALLYLSNMSFSKDIGDPVEALKAMYREKDEDSRLKNLPNQLSLDDVCESLEAKDAPRLHEFLKVLAEEKRTSVACDIATTVKLLTQIDLQPFLEILLEKRYLGLSPFLFQGASAQIRDRLIERVSVEPNQVLSALAWIGDDEVRRHFAKWKCTPPAWTDSLFITADNYSLEAGWELTSDGQRRELCFAECIPIVPACSEIKAAPQLQIIADASDSCHLCHRNLAFMIVSHTEQNSAIHHPALARSLKFLICEVCVEAGNTLLTEIDSQENFVWSTFNANTLDSRTYDTSLFPRNAMQLDNSFRNPYFGAVHPFPKQISQLGGHPTWLQDAEYPTCLVCETTMNFFGQLNYEELDSDLEGMLYSFTCENCKRFLAVKYQCT